MQFSWLLRNSHSFRDYLRCGSPDTTKRKKILKIVYVVVETDAKRFHLSNTDWGVPTFLDTKLFKFPVYGYIFNGEQCVFGIDVFVAQPFKKWEVFSYDENISNPVFTWNLTNFSTLNLDSYTSDSFTSGDRNWWLSLSLSTYTLTLWYVSMC